MDDSQVGKVTAQLVASEASAGAKGGRGDDLSGSDKVALKKKKNREKQARYRANMAAAQKRPRAHETEAQHTERKRKECERSATRWLNLTDERRAARRKYMRDYYMRKRRSKANLPPSPEEEEEADATAPPAPGPAPSPPEQDEEVMEAGDILKTLASSYETRSCRRHPPAATTAVHGAGAAPPHILEGPARPPVLKNVGPRRRSEMRAARRKYMCDYMRKRRSKANLLPPSPEEEDEEQEADATAPPPGPAPSPPEQDEEVMEAGDILKTLASSYETRSCRRHPPAATTAVHGAGAAPPHILEGPARPPVLKNVGPGRRSERIHVRTVEADDGRNRMRGHHAQLHLEGGGDNRREAGRGGRLPDTKPQPQMVFPKWAKSIISNHLDWTESTVPGEICSQNKAMHIECDDNCRGGARCSNKRIQRCKVKKVKKKRVEKGFGLFADEDIQKGEYVIEYIGKIMNKDPENEYGMKYKDFCLWVDGSKKNALAKRINHSCDPNCANHMWAVKGMPRLCFFANRNIVKGQELTFSYGWTLPKKDLKRKGTVCLCGAKSCSGTIEK